MNLDDAARMADELMAEHAPAGWTWRWAKGSKVMGHASHQRREVALYRPYASMAEPADVRETLLHEIGHALVPPRRDPRTGKRDIHGHEWKVAVRSIGGTPTRCGANPFYSQLKTARLPEARPVAAGGRAVIAAPNSRWDGATVEVLAASGPFTTVLLDGAERRLPTAYVRAL